MNEYELPKVELFLGTKYTQDIMDVPVSLLWAKGRAPGSV